MTKTAYIFVGQLGSGKSYRGCQYAIDTDLPFWDADDAIAPSLTNSVTPINKIIVHNFVNNTPEQIRLKTLESEYGIVVACTMYLDEERWRLKRYLEDSGIRVVFVIVKSSLPKTLWQLYNRPHNLQQMWHYLANYHLWQHPTHDYRMALRYE